MSTDYDFKSRKKHILEIKDKEGNEISLSSILSSVNALLANKSMDNLSTEGGLSIFVENETGFNAASVLMGMALAVFLDINKYEVDVKHEPIVSSDLSILKDRAQERYASELKTLGRELQDAHAFLETYSADFLEDN